MIAIASFAESRRPIQVFDFRATALSGGGRITYVTGLTASPHGMGLLVRSTTNTQQLLITSLSGKIEAVADLPDATNNARLDTDTAGNIVVITGVRSMLANRVQRVEKYSRTGIRLEERALPIIVREAALDRKA
jgi:hypothetical protein